MSARDFPVDEVLIARGKYSTLAGERRDALKGLQEDMTALANYASRILRAASARDSDIEFVRAELETASRRLGSALGHVQALGTLAPQLADLKPFAWGKGEPE